MLRCICVRLGCSQFRNNALTFPSSIKPMLPVQRCTFIATTFSSKGTVQANSGVHTAELPHIDAKI